MVLLKLFLCLICISGCEFNYRYDTSQDPPRQSSDVSKPFISTIGDSLTTGVFASSKLGYPPSVRIRDIFIRSLLSGNFHEALWQNKLSEYSYSATVGTADWTLRSFLAKQKNLKTIDLPIFVGARWGARLKDGKQYLQDFLLQYPNKKRPSHLVLMLGGNDYCRNAQLDNFTKEYQELTQAIIDTHPETSLVFVPIPRIPDAKRYSISYGPLISCQTIQKRFCPAMFEKTSENRFEEFNNQIQRIVEGHSAIPTNQNIVFVESVRHMVLNEEDYAFDCFHLSMQGQKRIAKKIIEALPTES